MRSYDKKKYRTAPTGVRFDIEKLDFIKSREKQLGTSQQIVDFLINKYWWEFHLPTVSHKEAPPLNLKNEPAFEKPQVVQVIQLKRTFQQYVALKRECDNEEDWAKLCDEINNSDHLSDRQKQMIFAS